MAKSHKKKSKKRKERRRRSQGHKEKSRPYEVFRQLKPRKKKGTKYVTEFLTCEERNDALDRAAIEEMELCENSSSDIDDIESISSDSETDVKDLLSEKLNRIKREFYREKPREGPYLIINNYKPQILSLIANNQAVVLTGPTGCGKSTQVPLFILDSCMERNEYCNIVVTQPRRIAATSVTKRVCNVRDWELGSICGFKVGLMDRTSPQTLLTYMTTGVLLQTLIKAKSLSQYTHIIIDEIHERDQSMDLLLIVIKKLLKQELNNVKIILMSATVEAEKFSKYFAKKLGDEVIPAPIMKIEDPVNYKVDVYYLDDLPFVENIPKMDLQNAHISEDIYDICLKLIKEFENFDKNEEEKSAVLVFLPGIHEIEHLYYKLKDPKVIGNEDYKWCLLPLHSTIAAEQQSEVFQPLEPGYRKIIISTNIAESSITVPGVKCVIDFCAVKRLKCDPTKNMNGLQLCWASQSNCVQRAGRTGRVMDGQVYRMVSKDFYETLDKESPSGMSEAPLEKIILQIKVFDMGEPLAILAHALDPPDLSDVEWSILILKETGALLRERRGIYTRHDGDLTFLGRLMAALPVDIHITKLIVMGHIFGCLTECIVMGASMAVKNVFAYPFTNRLKAYDMKTGWAENSSSDCIAFLNLYEIWTKYRKEGHFKSPNGEDERTWAASNFIHLHVLREISALVHELTIRLKEFQIEEPYSRPKTTLSNFERTLILKVALAGACYPYYYSTGFRYGDTYEKQARSELGGRNPLTTVEFQTFLLEQPVNMYYGLIGNYFKNMGCDVRLSSNKRNKIFVEFRHFESRMRLHEEKDYDEIAPSDILREVYRAVKIGQITKNIKTELQKVPEADTRADRIGFNSWNIVNPGYKPTTINYVPCPLPKLDISSIDIVISHIVNPGHFWALYSDNLADHKNILDTIRRHYSNLEPFKDTPVPGRMCIAPMHMNGEVFFHRARIENIDFEDPQPCAEVFFVDHGSYKTVDISELRQYGPELVKDLAHIPGQAFECVLTQIRPSSMRDVSGLWTKGALSAFRSIIQTGHLYGNIYSVVSGIVSLELHKKDENGIDININEFLINENYAEAGDENKFSKLNHSLRAEPSLDDCEKLYFNELQRQIWGPYPENEDLEIVEFNPTMKLKGPTSPLETILYGCTRISCGKNVVVSEESVNSVLLYNDPSDRHDRLVIAGNSSQNSDDSNLVINNVTVMPNIHGLAALIPIIFCPEAELRLDKEKTKFTGVLCGLGVDNRNRALFPEHDMEINFDTEIIPEDMVMVNSLRHYMNKLLKVNDRYHKNWTIIKQQTATRRIILKLLKRDRPSKNLDLEGSNYRWKGISPRVSVRRKLRIRNGMCSYPLHYIPFMYGDFCDSNLTI